MNNTTASFGSNIFGFIAGGFSLLALFLAVCRSHLPSHKIKILENLLDETEKVFHNAVEEGLLMEPDFILKIERRLVELKHYTASLRARAYSATTLHQDYIELFRGTSVAIGFGCRSLKILRAQVIVSSEEGRCKLLEDDHIPNTAHTLRPMSPPTPNVDVPLNPRVVHQVDIVRPSSCPPTIPARGPDDIRR